MEIAIWLMISAGIGAVMMVRWRRIDKMSDAEPYDYSEPPVPRGLPVSTVAEQPASTHMNRGEDFYSPLPATCVLVGAPLVDTDTGEVTLHEWLRHCHPERSHVWADVVTEFYTRAAATPTVADYFGGVDMTVLQRHFLAALMMVTGHGLTVGAVRQMQTKHADVRNSRGEPISEAVYDAAIDVLVDILAEMQVPAPTLRQVGATLAPLREAIVVRPDTDHEDRPR